MAATEGWLRTRRSNGWCTLEAGGRWDVTTAAALDSELQRLSTDGYERAVFEVGAIERLDMTGAWLVHRTLELLKSRGIETELAGVTPAQRTILVQVARSARQQDLERREGSRIFVVVERMGRATVWAVDEGAALLAFLGICVVTSGRVMLRPARIRFVPLLSHIERVGANALPIVGLLSFLIGVVVAFQGADQLRQFGAEIYAVNLLGVSILREMGILLAAIVVAGRSGSAFTAQIGTMQVNQEIDAMRTIGLDPIEVLVLPRIFALMLVMPLLCVYADLMGILGGALMSLVSLDISLISFLERFRTSIPIWSFWVGLIKAPFFGLMIALVGCHEGLRVSGSAESVGAQTTRSVVISIFLVIVGDAAFSIFFSIVKV